MGKDGVGEREEVRLGGGRGGDPAEGELEEHEVVALVSEEVGGRLRGAHAHPLGQGGHGACHRRARHLLWRRWRHDGGERGERGLGFDVRPGDGCGRVRLCGFIYSSARLLSTSTKKFLYGMWTQTATSPWIPQVRHTGRLILAHFAF